MLLQRPAKGLVGQDSREVIHNAMAFGLTDDGDHLVRCELPAREASLAPGGVLNGLELNFCDFDRHGSVTLYRLHPLRALTRHHFVPARAPHLSVRPREKRGPGTTHPAGLRGSGRSFAAGPCPRIRRYYPG